MYAYLDKTTGMWRVIGEDGEWLYTGNCEACEDYILRHADDGWDTPEQNNEADEWDEPAWHDDDDESCASCPENECTGHCMSCAYRPL